MISPVCQFRWWPADQALASLANIYSNKYRGVCEIFGALYAALIWEGQLFYFISINQICTKNLKYPREASFDCHHPSLLALFNSALPAVSCSLNFDPTDSFLICFWFESTICSVHWKACLLSVLLGAFKRIDLPLVTWNAHGLLPFPRYYKSALLWNRLLGGSRCSLWNNSSH